MPHRSWELKRPCQPSTYPPRNMISAPLPRKLPAVLLCAITKHVSVLILRIEQYRRLVVSAIHIKLATSGGNGRCSWGPFFSVSTGKIGFARTAMPTPPHALRPTWKLMRQNRKADQRKASRSCDPLIAKCCPALGPAVATRPGAGPKRATYRQSPPNGQER